MRIASTILTILGIVANFLYFSGEFIWLPILGAIFGIMMLISLASGKKITAIGVLGLIFTSLLGGIFYLCWKPEDVVKDDQNN